MSQRALTPSAAPSTHPSAVRVTAPARLHFGMIDVAGGARRRYGGVGVGITGPRVVVEARREDHGDWRAVGADEARATRFLRAAAGALGLPGGITVDVHEAIPGHHGLGSGTKLALATARAAAALHDCDPTTERLAAAAGRGERSAVGLWTFDGPGLILEGGPRPGHGAPGPLLGRWPMPSSWRCVLVIPRAAPGLSGAAEEEFFAAAHPGDGDPTAAAQQVLTALLPALVEEDVEEFGEALSSLQRITGAAFAAVQGGIFHPHAAPAVAALERAGAAGVGQSSWGPTAYGVTDDPERAAWIAKRVRDALGDDATVDVVDFDRTGTTVERSCSSS